MGYIDLHVHSKYSDGKHDVADILKMAYANNVSVLSLSEHYNLSSLYEVKRLIKRNPKYANIEIVPGIEIGANMSEYGVSHSHICHILAYYVNFKIYKVLAKYEEDRKKTDIRIIERLNQQEIDISYGKVKRYLKKDSFGRYDIAKYLVYKKLAISQEDAYAKYLDYNQMTHIDRRKMSPEVLIKRIIECEGVPILAHPKSLRFNFERLEQFLLPLIDCGLKGIEVYNPRNKEEERTRFSDICDKYGLIKTVGSDFHTTKDIIKIGKGIDDNLCIDNYDIIKRLKEEKHKLQFKHKKY